MGILAMLDRNDEDLLSITTQVNLARLIVDRDARIAEMEANEVRMLSFIERLTTPGCQP